MSETLQNVENKLEKEGACSSWNKEVLKMLKEANRYLKTNSAKVTWDQMRGLQIVALSSDLATLRGVVSEQCESHSQRNELCNYCCQLQYFHGL